MTIAKNFAALTVGTLTLRQVGGYEPQYRRPYCTVLSSSVADELVEIASKSPSANISVADLAGAASSFLYPSAVAEAVAIEGGWQAPRYYFELEVSAELPGLGSLVKETISGYTSALDPNCNDAEQLEQLRFFVTNVTSRRDTQVNPPEQGLVQTSICSHRSHVIAQNPYAGVYETQRLHRMRPEDVFAGISRVGIQGLGLDSGVVDLRTVVSSSPVFSRVANVIGMGYLRSIIVAMREAESTGEPGDGHQDLLATARGITAEDSLWRDFFFKALWNVQAKGQSNYFSWADLQLISPQAQVKYELRREDSKLEFTHCDGQGLPERLAYGLLHSGLAIAAHCGFDKVELVAKPTADHAWPQVKLRDFRGSVEYSQHRSEGALESWMNLQLKDLTMSGVLQCELDACFDTRGDSWVTLRVEGQAARTYRLPTFAAAMCAPVLTTSSQGFEQLTHDFDQLLTLLALLQQGQLSAPGKPLL